MNEKEFNPMQYYLMIAAGICIAIIRFINPKTTWSTIDFIKIGFGITMIGYGAYKLIKKK